MKRFLKKNLNWALAGVALATINAQAFIEGPYFNSAENDHYTDPYRGIYRNGNDFERIILREIERAEFSIDVAVQELRLPYVAQALARRFRDGLRVRVILENNYNKAVRDFDRNQVENGSGHSNRRQREYFNFVDMNRDGFLSRYEISQRDAVAILEDSGITIKDDTADRSAGSGLMHHKFIVVDNRRALFTTANFTLSDTHGDYSDRATRGNANSMMVLTEWNLVRKFQTEFDLMWGNRGFPRFGLKKPHRGAQEVRFHSRNVGRTNVTLQFSPTSRNYEYEESTNGLIARYMGKARSDVRLSLFVFSEQQIADAIEEAHHQYGARVRALIENTFAFQWYSEALDMLGLILPGPRCLIDENNRPWRRPIREVGVPNLPHGDFLHHKFATVDGRYTIVGSHNWSKAANEQNDETLLVIENAKVTQAYNQEHDRLFRTSSLGPSPRLLEKIREKSAECR